MIFFFCCCRFFCRSHNWVCKIRLDHKWIIDKQFLIDGTKSVSLPTKTNTFMNIYVCWAVCVSNAYAHCQHSRCRIPTMVVDVVVVCLCRRHHLASININSYSDWFYDILSNRHLRWMCTSNRTTENDINVYTLPCMRARVCIERICAFRWSYHIFFRPV